MDDVRDNDVGGSAAADVIHRVRDHISDTVWLTPTSALW